MAETRTTQKDAIPNVGGQSNLDENVVSGLLNLILHDKRTFTDLAQCFQRALWLLRSSAMAPLVGLEHLALQLPFLVGTKSHTSSR